MNLGDLFAGVLIGTGIGFTMGMCVPEDQKGDWIKKQQDIISKKWDKYDKQKGE